MSFNGSGTFVINSAGQPVVSGTVISSTAFNALTADLANGLSTCITKDGQTTPTADIPMGSNKITGLANGTAAGDAANLGQVQSTVAKLLGSVSGADTITAVGAPTVAAYAAGQMFYFVAAGANTGAVTINIDSLGAKNITRDGTTALAAGDIQSGEVCVIVYDGTQFQLVNGASQSASIVTENLTVNKATVLNESGGDNDTRIEGDTDANLFFVDASTDRIGIGTGSPSTKLHVVGGAATEIRVVTSGDLTTTGASFLRFGGSNSGTSGYLGYGGTGNTYDIYNGLNGPLEFYTNASKKMVLDASGNLCVGSSAPGNAGAINVSVGLAGTTAGGLQLWGATNSNHYVQFGDGTSSSDPYRGFVGYLHSSDSLVFGTSTLERMRLDAAGNAGLGVTPSAWDTLTALQVKNAHIGGVVDNAYFGANCFYNGVNWTYIATNEANRIELQSGKFEFYTAASGTAGDPITFGDAKMTLDASGNLGVGTTSPTTRLHINGTGGQYLRSFSTSNSVDSYFGSQTNEATVTVASNHPLTFVTNNTERCRVTAGGDLLVGTTSTTPNPGVAIFASGGIGQGNSAASSGFEFHSFRRSAVQIGSITQNGTTAVAYNTSSDRRLKENIVPAPDAGAKIDAIEIVSHDWKSTPDEHVEFGVVAQDLALIAPQAVTAGDEGEEIEKTWGVDYSKLVPMLVKEIQSLRARLAALEAK
jgi:hypothetical protein